ncbi:MAG: hypothetical protein ACRDHM_10870 [Actinomycetota bacterium]
MALRAASLALVLALSGCAEQTAPGGEGKPLTRPDPVILELQSDEKEPIGLLSYGGEDQAGELGTHCWATQCVDFIGPPTPKTFTEVPGDAVIELTGDGEAESISVGAPPSEEFGQLGDEKEIQVEDRRARLDLEPGRYVLVVFARWNEGDAVLTFGLEAR